MTALNSNKYSTLNLTSIPTIAHVTMLRSTIYIHPYEKSTHFKSEGNTVNGWNQLPGHADDTYLSCIDYGGNSFAANRKPCTMEGYLQVRQDIGWKIAVPKGLDGLSLTSMSQLKSNPNYLKTLVVKCTKIE